VYGVGDKRGVYCMNSNACGNTECAFDARKVKDGW
jgi:hypothetical protein